MESDAVGRPIDASEVVVRVNWRLEGLQWRNKISKMIFKEIKVLDGLDRSATR